MFILNFTCNLWYVIPKEFKGGIGCGGHFAIEYQYGGELLYVRIFHS